MKVDAHNYVHFRSDVEVQELSCKKVTLLSSNLQVSWSEPSKALHYCVSALKKGKMEKDLIEEWIGKKQEDLSHFFYFFEQLSRRQMICYSVMNRQQIIATLIPFRYSQDIYQTAPLDETQPLQLSRFAYVRTDQGKLVLESPLVSARIEMKHFCCLELLYALSSEKKLEDLLAQCKSLSKEAVFGLLNLLHKGNFLSSADKSQSLQTWDFHDLLFHARSRIGRHEEPFGATFRFLGKMDPYPVLGRFTGKPLISLFKPDIDRLSKEEDSFTHVLEERKSIREQGAKSLTLEQLGEFLYRVIRIKKFEDRKSHYEMTRRPVPGGGACHELELYPVIYQCEGVDKGVYHYHPEKHGLDICAPWNEEVEALLENAEKSTGKTKLPQVLIVITSRFGRVSWKYQSMAYSVILKNTGVLIQTMYLVATAMGLAPCGVGAGNADLFSNIVNTDYYEESSVGEFILGTKDEDKLNE